MGKNYKAWEQATEVEVQLLSTTKDWGNKDRKQRHVKDINMVEAISRSTKPLTNHSRQVWRSIYNNHIDVKTFPTMIWMHKEQATLLNAQSHLYEGTRQNMHVSKHKNANQTFWIFYFLCVFGFFDTKTSKGLSKEM